MHFGLSYTHKLHLRPLKRHILEKKLSRLNMSMCMRENELLACYVTLCASFSSPLSACGAKKLSVGAGVYVAKWIFFACLYIHTVHAIVVSIAKPVTTFCLRF